MPIIRTAAIEISYFEHGDPTGTPVILLHGFPDSYRTWDGVIQQLRGLKLRLITPEQRGYGGSHVIAADAGGGQVAALGQDVIDFADAMGIEKFLMVGHDWGARAGYVVAALAPQRLLGLVALASPYVSFEQQPLPPKQIQAYWYQFYFNTETGRKGLAANTIAFCKHLWQAWSPKWVFGEAEFSQASEAWHRPEFVETVVHSYRMRYGNAESAPRYAALQKLFDASPKLTVPTWFAAGLADACTLPDGPDGQEHWFTGGYRRVDVADAGHFVQRERPDLVAGVIREALMIGS